MSEPASGGPMPAIVLVEPQIGENIGAAARAMLNFGLDDLRLVRPRDGWPNVKAIASAVGATPVLDKVRVCATLAEALADRTVVYATTARAREMLKPVVTLDHAADGMREAARAGERVAVMFGPERTGLTNDDIAIADWALTIPANPAFTSINLAQSVLLVAYAWHRTADATPPLRLPPGQTRRATRAELVNFLDHLVRELDKTPFLANKQQRPSMIRNIRAFFLRARPFEQEVRTLHGIVAELSKRREGQDGR